ncbi:ribosome biogenesis protein BMS1 homolog [Orussus abietinus]|uniref:ribosome biogenesis protein BMS1 homolog n=1 Tax=Orussus abietinus TaxID=222816 RepID=UPI0006264672|nr:ribosome biogenesis protein BMS1 homolog [Orussus abietinus]
MSTVDNESTKHKSHRDRNAGRKAEKKKAKNVHIQELSGKQKNPKAFTFNSAIKAERRFRRKQDIEAKRQHLPLVDRTPLEPPPVLVAVVGPPKVGKSLVIQCLIKAFARQPLTSIIGPVTVVSGKKQRITFMECNNDVNSMIDIAKVADLVLLLVDASFGFEMEIFEFLNICQVHGMPRIMGVLTHLDLIKNAKQLRKTKKQLKHRFWTEVYAGAKLFYLSGLLHDEYLRNEIKNLSRFISVMKFRPLTWRTTHPYLLADRIEDLTSPELIRKDVKVDRTISLYGYVRGVPFNKQSSVHIPGCGDLKIKDISFLPDPCPLPEHLKKRSLIEKERLIYAPFSGVGGIVYDKDAVYVELGGSHSYKEDDTGLIGSLMATQETLDKKLQHSELQIFSESAPIKAKDVTDDFCTPVYDESKSGDKRIRRKVTFKDSNDSDQGNESSDDDDELPNVNKDQSELESDNDMMSVDDSDSDEASEKGTSKRKRKGITSKNEEKKMVKKRKFDVLNANDLDEELKILRAKGVKHEGTKKEDKFEEQIYKRPSKNPENHVKSKIAEALNMLNAEEREGNSRLDSDDVRNEESFDELSEDELEARENMEIDKLNHDIDSDENEEDDDEKNEDEEEDEDNLNWKSNLTEKASQAFIARQQSTRNLMKVVYGVFNESTSSRENVDSKEDRDEEEEIGGIFRAMTRQQKEKLRDRELKNQEESVFYSSEPPRDWLFEDNKVFLTNRFVTGKWKESEDAEMLLKLDDMSDEELYGDFEDLETKEKHLAETSKDQKSSKEIPIDDTEEKKKLLEKKRELKEKFDSEYDNGEGKTYYDELKSEAEKQAQLNRSEFENMDDEARVQLEGFRAGMYVRIEIESVPSELITHLDPTYPLVVGGLLHREENIGMVQTRIKKHRWYSKILKSKDPIILSIGWRRFQTLPIYSKLEDNLRSRMLKYTPEHVACMAHFWGPITPQGSGVLAIQDVSVRTPGFRIAATGSIVEIDKTAQVMKKLKLTGVPMKIYKKTAFIKDMFNSSLEVAKFEGAKIKTVSGIRGQIKKAVSKPEGCFRATFEDKILLSDIVFCRTWYTVEVPRFYNPVTSLLLPPSTKSQWRGMKTTGQLKRENKIRVEPNVDSLYTPIEREVRVFKPLVIPKSLQKDLPYRDKPKLPGTHKHTFEEKRVAVVREPKEENIARLMKMIKTTYNRKQEQLKEATSKRMAAHQAQVEAEEAKKLQRQKELKKQVFRQLSKMEAKNKKRASKS